MNTWHAAAALTEIGDIVEDQENIDFVRQTLQADPMMTANNMNILPIVIQSDHNTESYFGPLNHAA